MAIPKLETASIAPPPPPTRLEKLNCFDATIRAYTPALQSLFQFIVGASLGGLLIVAVVTFLILGVGFALFVLVQGPKVAISCSKGGARCVFRGMDI